VNRAAETLWLVTSARRNAKCPPMRFRGEYTISKEARPSARGESVTASREGDVVTSTGIYRPIRESEKTMEDTRWHISAVMDRYRG
jgi:hypothetical protein